MGFRIKVIVSYLLNLIHISDLILKNLNWKYHNEYIRIVNYHEVYKKNIKQFEKQIKWYKKHFANINYEQFEEFLSTGKLPSTKPGIMLTFDDGYIGNYENALQILEQNSMTGYFLVSSDLVGNVGYMKAEQLKDLIKRGHIIGDHTATHHRMMEDDTKETLEYEIKESKIKLEKMLDTKINIFCWCGGEEEHYTKKAYDKIINAKYKYGFMTNSAPVICSTNRMHIQRINIEDSWSISLTKLQVSGFMDKHFEAKRKRVDIKLKEIEGI